MATLARFWVVFVLTMLLPHIEGSFRWPYLLVYAYTLYELLWRGLRRI